MSIFRLLCITIHDVLSMTFRLYVVMSKYGYQPHICYQIHTIGLLDALLHSIFLFWYSTELLTELLSSPDLYVMQVEMDVYTLAKRVCVCVVLIHVACYSS